VPSLVHVKLRLRRISIISVLMLPVFPSALAACGLTLDESLKTFCLLDNLQEKKLLPPQTLMLARNLKKQGYLNGFNVFGKTKGSPIIFSIKGISRYSQNINGGNPAQNLELGRLSFVGDPASYAKEGLLVGAALNVSGRLIYGEGRYLNYNLNTSYAYSTKHTLGVATSSVSACSVNHIADWWYLDVCGGGSRTRKQITDQSSESLSIILAKVLSGGTSKYHKVRIGGNRHFASTYVQDQFLFGVDTIHSESVTSGMTATIGESVDNKLAIKASISAHLGLILNKKTLSVKASYNGSDGGKLLGFDRSDGAFNLSVSYPLTDYVSANLGYHKTNSSIDYYDTKYPTFGLQLKSLSF